MSNNTDYTVYHTIDFLEDSYFIAWMRGNDASVNDWWENWLLEHPEKAADIKEAKDKYLMLVSFDKPVADNKAYNEVWNNITYKTNFYQSQPELTQGSSFKKWFWIAASVIIIFSVPFFYLTRTKKEEVILSATGILKKLTLTDGSVVTLNKYSSITYFKPEVREVWIKGEAFFEVNKQLTKDHLAEPFLVHAGTMTITVTGTSFSVVNKGKETSTVLTEGSINAALENTAIQLKPGDKLELVENKFVKTKVNPQLFSAWKDGEFHFDKTTLAELKEVIKYAYGLELIIKDENKIKSKTVSGVISAVSREKFLLALSVVLDVDIKTNDSTIMLKPK